MYRRWPQGLLSARQVHPDSKEDMFLDQEEEDEEALAASIAAIDLAHAKAAASTHRIPRHEETGGLTAGSWIPTVGVFPSTTRVASAPSSRGAMQGAPALLCDMPDGHPRAPTQPASTTRRDHEDEDAGEDGDFSSHRLRTVSIQSGTVRHPGHPCIDGRRPPSPTVIMDTPASVPTQAHAEGVAGLVDGRSMPESHSGVSQIIDGGVDKSRHFLSSPSIPREHHRTSHERRGTAIPPPSAVLPLAASARPPDSRQRHVAASVLPPQHSHPRVQAPSAMTRSGSGAATLPSDSSLVGPASAPALASSREPITTPPSGPMVDGASFPGASVPTVVQKRRKRGPSRPTGSLVHAALRSVVGSAPSPPSGTGRSKEEPGSSQGRSIPLAPAATARDPRGTPSERLRHETAGRTTEPGMTASSLPPSLPHWWNVHDLCCWLDPVSAQVRTGKVIAVIRNRRCARIAVDGARGVTEVPLTALLQPTTTPAPPMTTTTTTTTTKTPPPGIAPLALASGPAVPVASQSVQAPFPQPDPTLQRTSSSPAVPGTTGVGALPTGSRCRAVYTGDGLVYDAMVTGPIKDGVFGGC